MEIYLLLLLSVFYQKIDCGNETKRVANVPNYLASDYPKTTFTCDNKPGDGFYADIDSQCQSFHMCQGGKSESFLCPVGTVFSQRDLVCDFWYNVDCSTTATYYNQPVSKDVESLETIHDYKTIHADGFVVPPEAEESSNTDSVSETTEEPPLPVNSPNKINKPTIVRIPYLPENLETESDSVEPPVIQPVHAPSSTPPALSFTGEIPEPIVEDSNLLAFHRNDTVKLPSNDDKPFIDPINHSSHRIKFPNLENDGNLHYKLTPTKLIPATERTDSETSLSKTTVLAPAFDAIPQPHIKYAIPDVEPGYQQDTVITEPTLQLEPTVALKIKTRSIRLPSHKVMIRIRPNINFKYPPYKSSNRVKIVTTQEQINVL